MNKGKQIGILGVEHIILNIIYISELLGRGITSEKIIHEINYKNLDKITLKKLSNGSIYGNISRLKDRGLIKKSFIGNAPDQILVYKTTEQGKVILSETNNRLQELLSSLEL